MALAAIFGFMASIYFIAGAITMSGKNIQMLSGTYWDYNRHIAKALSSQRAEYISGSIALGLSFVLQLSSTLIPQSLLESHLLSLYNSICLIFLILLGTIYLSFCLYKSLRRSTYKKVLLARRTEEVEYQRQKALQHQKKK
jgi:hypothetical protein